MWGTGSVHLEAKVPTGIEPAVTRLRQMVGRFRVHPAVVVRGRKPPATHGSSRVPVPRDVRQSTAAMKATLSTGGLAFLALCAFLPEKRQKRYRTR